MIAKKLKFLLLLFLIISCKDEKEIVTPQKESVIVVKSVPSDTLTVQKNEIIDISNSKDWFKVLLPNSYRIFDNEDPTKSLTNDWFDLHEKEGKYYLERATYNITKGFDECAGVDTKTIETNRKTILLLDYSKLSAGEVTSLPIAKKYIWPKQQQLFSFNNHSYKFRAEGVIEDNLKLKSDTDDETLWGKVKNYKLYLSFNNKSEVLIISEDDFQDTFVELLFVGDIDRDGKLDFIFGANRNYEETRVILFLSSKGQDNIPIQKVSEISIQHDC